MSGTMSVFAVVREASVFEDLACQAQSFGCLILVITPKYPIWISVHLSVSLSLPLSPSSLSSLLSFLSFFLLSLPPHFKTHFS